MDLKGKALAVREGDFRSCVMLMDCEKLKSMIPSVDILKQYSPEAQTEIIKQLIPFSTPYDKRWNCLDGEDRRSCLHLKLIPEAIWFIFGNIYKRN